VEGGGRRRKSPKRRGVGCAAAAAGSGGRCNCYHAPLRALTGDVEVVAAGRCVGEGRGARVGLRLRRGAKDWNVSGPRSAERLAQPSVGAMGPRAPGHSRRRRRRASTRTSRRSQRPRHCPAPCPGGRRGRAALRRADLGAQLWAEQGEAKTLGMRQRWAGSETTNSGRQGHAGTNGHEPIFELGAHPCLTPLMIGREDERGTMVLAAGEGGKGNLRSAGTGRAGGRAGGRTATTGRRQHSFHSGGGDNLAGAGNSAATLGTGAPDCNAGALMTPACSVASANASPTAAART
jgi:hypothetical protein